MILSKNYLIEGFLIKENTFIESSENYDYICVKAENFLNTTQINELEELQKVIPKNEVYIDNDGSKGLEKDFHITVFYGLLPHKYNYKLIKQYIQKNFENITIKVFGPSYFDREDRNYKVLKLDIESQDLEKIHNYIRTLPNEETFPEYKPHLTIAYLHKSSQLIPEQFTTSFCGKTFNVSNISFLDVFKQESFLL